MCSDVFNNNMRGSKFSEKYSRVNIKLNKCIKGSLKDKNGKVKNCKSYSAVKQFFRENEIQIIYKDMFTDMDDPKLPVKYYINERISTGLNPQTVKNFDFFL